jgi:hypothetical protein
MSLTPAQRHAALAHIANVSDDTLACLAWEAVGYNENINADLAEACAIHCDNVVARSSQSVDVENEQHRDNARHNVKWYGVHAKRLRSLHSELEIEVNAELVRV